MELDFLDIRFRKKIIAEIKGDENVQRKIVSYKKFNMQEDNFYQYVKESLEAKLDYETVSEMTIFSSINLQRRISKAEASIYKRKPERSININDKESPEMGKVYELMDIDTCLRRANEAYKYQGQCAIQVYPESGELKCRVLLPHLYDVIPDPENPEKVIAYIISNFDNTTRDRIRKDDRNGHSQGNTYRDGSNQTIADYDDQKLKHERYYVWTKTLNFVMNGKGEILDKITDAAIEEVSIDDPNVTSPLADYECLPFVDVSHSKNFEYWVRGHESLFDATIIYNTILTSEFQTVEMQGHAQAYYKGDANHLPQNMRIGPDKIIIIPIDANNPTNAEFGFANPGSDLNGIREFRESFLAAFLSSRGLDTSIISGKPSTSTATSGVEKLLEMVEKAEAGQEDLSVFEQVESKLNQVICCFIRALFSEAVDGVPVLIEPFRVSLPESKEEITVNVQFAKPEMIKSEMEMLEIAQKELELGLTSKVHLLMKLKNMTMKEAIRYAKEVEQFEVLNARDIQAEV
jgi:hypothetical protein